jgi:diguanylate cyclase (GGDEF)-like protein
MLVKRLWNSVTRYVGRFLEGDLTLFGGPALPAAVAGRIRAEQLGIVSRYTCGMMLANVFNGFVLLGALWSSSTRQEGLAWSFVLITFATYLYLKRRANVGRSMPTSLPERVVTRAVANAAFMGLIWAALPFFIFDHAGYDGQMVILCLCVGMSCGGALSLASVPAAAIVFLAPLSFASVYAIIRFDSPVHLLLVSLLIVYNFAIMRGVVTYACQITRRAIEHLESEEAASIDGLTKLFNRNAFKTRMEAALSRLNDYGEGFAVFFFDMDDFKRVNDTFGHASGDDLLRQVADRIQSCLRDGDTLARLGGDEFAMIAAKAAKPEQAMVVAERILKAFTAPFAVDGRQIYSGLSIGISLAPADGADLDGLLGKADGALYMAKRNGRGAYDFFTKDHDDVVKERQLLERQLRSAVRNQELHLEFQPMIDLKTGKLMGREALVRWENPTCGPVSPAVFIPVAEHIGVIQELGEWVIRESIAIAATWPPDVKLAINVSAIQFRTPRLLTVLHEALSEHDMRATRIEIEITESTLIAESGSAINLLNTLRQWGVRVALDDFGTGYSSLDKIKIDRSFVATLLTRPASAALIKAVLGLARDLNMVVTAEGIETPEQLAALEALQCDEGQGYLLGRPARLSRNEAVDGDVPVDVEIGGQALLTLSL